VKKNKRKDSDFSLMLSVQGGRTIKKLQPHEQIYPQNCTHSRFLEGVASELFYSVLYTRVKLQHKTTQNSFLATVLRTENTHFGSLNALWTFQLDFARSVSLLQIFGTIKAESNV
jgi:hypothetical protein